MGDRRSPDRRYSREDSRDDHHHDADKRRVSRSRSPSPMVTGPSSTKDKKVKKGKKTKKRKHHETTGSDSEHQQSSEKKKKSKKTSQTQPLPWQPLLWQPLSKPNSLFQSLASGRKSPVTSSATTPRPRRKPTATTATCELSSKPNPPSHIHH